MDRNMEEQMMQDLMMEQQQADELSNIIVLNDENGNEVPFEFLDLIEYRGKEYVVLLPVDDEAGEVVILGVEPIEGTDEESYVSVSDDEMMAVFEIFKEKFADVFNFGE